MTERRCCLPPSRLVTRLHQPRPGPSRVGEPHLGCWPGREGEST